MILRKGDKYIGSFHFPDKKKPRIGYALGSGIYDCGQFNSEEDAEQFMSVLAEMIGVDAEKESEDGERKDVVKNDTGRYE